MHTFVEGLRLNECLYEVQRQRSERRRGCVVCVEVVVVEGWRRSCEGAKISRKEFAKSFGLSGR